MKRAHLLLAAVTLASLAPALTAEALPRSKDLVRFWPGRRLDWAISWVVGSDDRAKPLRPPIETTIGTAPGAKPALTLIALHGVGTSPDQPLLTKLLRDLDARGISARVVRPYWSNGTRTGPRLEALVQKHLEKDGVPVVILGHSLGAGAGLAVAANQPRVAGVVALAPALWWSKWPRVKAPLLVVHGTADDQLPVGTSRRYVARTPQALYVQVEGGGHGFGQKLARDLADWRANPAVELLDTEAHDRLPQLTPEDEARLPTSPQIKAKIADQTAAFLRALTENAPERAR